MVYYLYFQCSCYHLLLHVCLVGSRFSEARFGRETRWSTRKKHEDSVYTAASQLLKKENHRPNRLKSAAYPPAVRFERNHMLQERIWFWCSFFYVCTCRTCIKRYHEFFSCSSKTILYYWGETFCHKFKGAVGYWLSGFTKPGNVLDFLSLFNFVKKFRKKIPVLRICQYYFRFWSADP